VPMEPSTNARSLMSRYLRTCSLAAWNLPCASPTSIRTGTQTTTSTGEGPYLQVTTGMRHSCAIKKDRTVVCWGYNGVGQLGAPSGTFSQISGGILHTCGIRTDGTVTCWGGLSSCARAAAPGASYAKIAVGSEDACGLTTQGTVQCWGCTDEVVPAFSAIDVTAGGAYYGAISSAGRLVCWGRIPYRPSLVWTPSTCSSDMAASTPPTVPFPVGKRRS
jgi:hypothetical protein